MEINLDERVMRAMIAETVRAIVEREARPGGMLVHHLEQKVCEAVEAYAPDFVAVAVKMAVRDKLEGVVGRVVERALARHARAAVGAFVLTGAKKTVIVDNSAHPEGGAKGGPVTLLPDGSAFATASWPLPADHWLYCDGEEQAKHEQAMFGSLPLDPGECADRGQVRRATRIALRKATENGKAADYDPDCVVQQLVLALFGPDALAEEALVIEKQEPPGGMPF